MGSASPPPGHGHLVLKPRCVLDTLGVTELRKGNCVRSELSNSEILDFRDVGSSEFMCAICLVDLLECVLLSLDVFEMCAGCAFFILLDVLLNI